MVRTADSFRTAWSQVKHLFGIAQDAYGDGDLWPRLFVSNRDRISDPDVIHVGQVLRVPFGGP